MADGVDLILDGKSIEQAGDSMVRAYLGAAKRAVGTATRLGEQDLESATAAAGAGKLARAWKSDVYPRTGIARDPTGEIFGNGSYRTQGALIYWTQAGSARPARGGFFAVPTAAIGMSPRSVRSQATQYMITPREWQQRTGLGLRLLAEPGKSPVLMAFAPPGSRKRVPKGPIFVLIPQFSLRGAVSIDAVLAAAREALPAEFLTEVAALR